MEIERYLVISEKTPWGDIEVWAQGNVRYLYLQSKTATQSQINIKQKEKLLLQHSRAMMSFLLFQPNPKSVLILGTGGGSIIHFLCHWFPTLKIAAVDINEKMLSIAKEYFLIPEASQINMQIGDAATYLTDADKENRDVIFVDVHDGNHLPEFVSTPDFLAQCFHSLSAEGVLVINLLVSSNQDFLKIMQALRHSFTGVSLCMTLTQQKNILLFAFKSLDKLDMNQLRKQADQCKEKYDIEFDQFINDIVVVDAK